VKEVSGGEGGKAGFPTGGSIDWVVEKETTNLDGHTDLEKKKGLTTQDARERAFCSLSHGLRFDNFKENNSLFQAIQTWKGPGEPSACGNVEKN